LPLALHFLPEGSAAIDAIRIKLDSHRIRIQLIGIDLNLKRVMLAARI
jgi:hypothetical protein